MSYSNVGTVWDDVAFQKYIDSLPALSWANSITLHHTGSPSLTQRPAGWKIQHMRNLEYFYKKQLGWSRGPHGFIDENQIFGLSPFTERGVHARSFNANSIGLEVLGNYDREDPLTGRGFECWDMTFKVVAILLNKMGLEANGQTIKFHREDPKTSKSCPGDKVQKKWVVDGVKRYIKSSNHLNDQADRVDESDLNSPIVPGWSNYELRDGVWYVPAVPFMEHLGDHGALKMLKHRGENLYYGSRIIQHHYYDKVNCKTWVSLANMINI